MSNVKVKSEVGRLKRMIMHRPSEELNNLVPHYLDIQLFDDIPWLQMAQYEHDKYAELLRGLGVEVLYIEDLVAQAASGEEERKLLLKRFIEEANIYSSSKRNYIFDYMLDRDVDEMVGIMIGGLRKSEIKAKGCHLADYLKDEYPFVLDPMPNMYFTRDPFSFLGEGVAISRMYMSARSRETLFGDFVMDFHPMFKGIKKYYERNARFSLEGGDVMVLGNGYIAVGISQRTNVNAVEELACRILSDEESGFKGVLAVDIPKIRSYMHLDTVFTMVDKDAFAIHPGVVSEFKMFSITKKDNKINISEETASLSDTLKKILCVDEIRLIKCGGMSYVDSAREQWNDGANTLAVAPGEIVVYARNTFTNKLFSDNGIKTYEIPCSELSRGRGGPHCMSMAVYREDL